MGGNLAARLGGLVSLALMAFVVARLGGAEGPALVGMLALLRVLPPYVATVFTGGLNGACVYFLAGPERSNPHLRLTLLALAIAGGLTGAALWLLADPLLARLFFPNLSWGLVALAGAKVLTYTFVSTARGCQQGTEDLTGANWVFFLEDAAALPLLIGLVALGTGFHASIVVSLLLGDVLISLLAWTRLSRRGFFRQPLELPSLSVARRVVIFGAKSELASIAQILNLRINVLMLGALAGPGALGTYFVASRFAEMLRLPAIALQFILQPRYAAISRRAAAVKARALIPRAGLLTVAGAVPLALAVFLIPVIYGGPFSSAILPAQILLLGLTTEGLNAVTSAYLYGTGRPGLTSVAMGVGLVVTIGLDVWLIPPLGALGAALASGVAYVATTIVLMLCFYLLTRSVRPGAPGTAAEESSASTPLPVGPTEEMQPRYSTR
jgi:O-antigen/teichoic acid export membrane protein